MQISEVNNSVTLKNFKNFDLGQTLDCGQCFRFKKISENTYHGIAFGKSLEISQKNGQITLKNTTRNEYETIWKSFFDLETNYENIWQNLSGISPFLSDAHDFAGGIRILKQDSWEALCSFIISQNNNIPRIKKIIEKLCKLFGKKIEKSENDYSFPTAKQLSDLSPEDLSPIKSGFRAKYIIDAAKKVSSGEVNLEKLKCASFDEATNSLMSIKGVGPKVSSCVLLYGFHKLEAFPMDVWMKKIMNTYFEGKTPKIFGKYAGVAQQYMYHYSRTYSNIIF